MLSYSHLSQVYWLCKLHPTGPRFGFFLTDLFLALFVAEGLIHFISAVVPFFIMGLVAAAGVYGMRACLRYRSELNGIVSCLCLFLDTLSLSLSTSLLSLSQSTLIK